MVNTLQAITLSGTESDFKSEPFRGARTEFNIFWEGVKRKFGDLQILKDAANWVGMNLSCGRDTKPDCWSYKLLDHYFLSPKLTVKERGGNFFLLLLLAPVLQLVLWLVYKKVYKRLYG